MSTAGHARPIDAGARAWTGRVRLACADIKVAHSVFALPFALVGAFLARPEGGGWGVFGAQLALVVVCMVLARTWAMLVNRLADRRIDAENPRTAGRVIASGRLPVRDALALALACALGFVGACALFALFFGNPWPLLLSVPVLGWIALYSFTKRFTALCHVFLGAALGVSPVAAAIAVEPGSAASTPALWAIGGMVVLWVAGFDVIYALQDIDFDRRAGLHSIPARLGWRGGIAVSRAMHAGALGMLMVALVVEPRFGALFGLGVGAVGVLLVAEHVVLAKRGKAGLEMAFFTLNGVVSCVLGAAAITDVLVG